MQPRAFPRFAEELFGSSVGETLAAEDRAEMQGKPDFTPADAVAHVIPALERDAADRMDAILDVV